MNAIAVFEDKICLSSTASSWVQSQGITPDRINVRGREVDSVPYTLDSVVLFQNMGATLPTDMLNGKFKYGGRFKPYTHQKETSDFLVRNFKAFCLNSPGTGKTASAIWAAEHLMQEGLVQRVLVLCPLSCVDSVWSKEVFSLVPHRTQTTLTGPAPTRRKLMEQGYEWLITNHDGIKTLKKEFMAKDSGITLVILDEATAFKNETTDRSKALKAVVKGKRLWMLTGTPRPQNPVDAYLMCKLINDKAPQRKYLFEDLTTVKLPHSKWTRVPKKNANEIVREFMQPAIRFSKKECLDLPDVVHTYQQVGVSKEHKRLRDEIRKEWLTEVEQVDKQGDSVSHVVTAQNAAIRLNKLMQLGQGIIIDANGMPHPVDNKERLDACLELTKSSESKTLIFVNYTAAMDKLEKYFTSKGYNPACVSGRTSSTQRNDIFKNFQSDAASPSPINPIIAHPKTVAHGVTLTEASTTIWYGPCYSVEQYEQGNNRTDRPGQTLVPRIIHLWSTPEERKVYEGLTERVGQQKMLLDSYEVATDEI